MTAEELMAFKKQLLALKSATKTEMVGASESTGVVSLDQTKVGRLSRIDAMQSQQLALESQRRRKSMIVAIDGALERIESGIFGLCYNCQEPIGIDRLKINPTATRCVDCMVIT